MKKKKKSQAWKSAEKGVAKILNGVRNQRVIMKFFDSMPDIDHFLLVPEIKHGYKFPSYLAKWFKEAEKYDNPDDKIRCVIWGSKNKKTTDKIVMIKLDEFKKLLDKIDKYNNHVYRYKAASIINTLLKELENTLVKFEKFQINIKKKRKINE